MSEHIQLFFSVNPKGFVNIALNKLDLVEQEELVNLLNYYQFKEQERVLATYSTSAKTGSSVDEIFQKLAYRIIELGLTTFLKNSHPLAGWSIYQLKTLKLLFLVPAILLISRYFEDDMQKESSHETA